MGRKKTITKLNEKYILNDFVETDFIGDRLLGLGLLFNLVVISSFGWYFLAELKMLDKICTFVISGKLIGTDYALTFSNVCWISAVIVAAMLSRSIYNYLKVAKNRNKIKLQIKDATPSALNIRITA